MRKNSFCFSVVVLQMILSAFSCQSIRASSPYSLTGEFQSAAEKTLLSFSLTNNSQKEIKKVEFVFSAYDQNGEPIFGNDFQTERMSLNILPNETISDFFEISELFDFLEEDFELDYFYVSKIYYEDGSVFEDPLGRFAL